jgi:hypothetical protein
VCVWEREREKEREKEGADSTHMNVCYELSICDKKILPVYKRVDLI